MKSSENKQHIDELVFHWDQKSASFSNNSKRGKKPSIGEYLNFLEDMNSQHHRAHKKHLTYESDVFWLKDR